MRVAIDHREAILQAAARLFARKPFHEVLMDDVAERTGIAKGTVYRHFPTKEDLFATLALRHLELVETEMAAQAALPGQPLPKLETMIARLVELILQYNDFFRVMQRHECDLTSNGSSPLGQRRKMTRDYFVAILREATEAGELACPFPLPLAADMMMGMIRNTLRFSNPIPQPVEVARMVMHVFLHGLKPCSNGAATAVAGASVFEGGGA